MNVILLLVALAPTVCAIAAVYYIEYVRKYHFLEGLVIPYVLFSLILALISPFLDNDEDLV